MALTAADGVLAFLLGGDRIGRAQVRLGQAEDLLLERRHCPASTSSRGSFAAFSASLMMASITGWKCRWPNITAPSMMSSVSSLASDSTISTASAVPATTRSSWLSSISSSVGLSTYSLLMKPTRAAPIGPMKGAPDSVSAAEAATMRHDVGIVFQVVGQHGDDHLGFVAPALGEQRADRAVDQAGDQRLLFGRAAFALEVAAGNAARGVGLLLVVDGERQEVDAFASALLAATTVASTMVSP